MFQTKRECASEKEKLSRESNDVDKIIEEYLGPEDDTICGVGPCRGGPLQFLAKPVIYLIASSIIALVQGLFFTYSNATLSSVEKDFGLPSRLSGFTTTGNDVIQLLLSIPLPFFASRGHRPRWLAFGMFLSAVGCLVAVSPHLIFTSQKRADTFIQENLPEDEFYSNGSTFCKTNNETISCDLTSVTTDNTAKGVVSLFLIAQMLAGVASLLYYTIGYSYLDEAVTKAKAPLFLSISGAMRLLGPVCGYSMASWALSMWKYPSETSNISLTPAHPRWVGAWWLGYVIIGSVLLGISWVLILLPKTLPATRKRKQEELENMAFRSPDEFLHHAKSLRPTKSPEWNGLLPSLRRLALNAVFRLVVIKQVLFWFAFYGYITFKSKYLEHQFRLSASEANRYIAGVSLLAALVGWLGTGATLSFLKPKPKTVIVYMVFLSCVSCLCHLGQLTISCDHPDTEGLDEVIWYREGNKYNASDVTYCEVECGCLSERFSPVCSNYNSTFFNPCFARCSSNFLVSGNQRTDADVGQRINIEKGFCTPNCPSFLFYLIISVVAKMAQAASRVPVNILLLRCTEERDKDLGLGIFNAMIALGSSIPAPIIFGWAIDASCILWDSSCKDENACWLYNVKSFRSIVHGIPAGFLALCLATDFLLFKHHEQLELYSTKGCENKKKREKAGPSKKHDTLL